MLNVDEILNSLSELVYISDIDTYELLYMNEASQKKYNTDGQYKGKTCYQVLQGRDAPCEFCTNSLLSRDRFYNWEYYSALSKTHYLLKDKLIEYNGKLVRFEIATDVTELKAQNAALEHLRSMDDLLIKCVAKLHENLSIHMRINTILKLTGEFLNADRVYIFESIDGLFNNTYEWCREGVQPQKANLQKMDNILFERWQLAFSNNDCIIIDDLEKIKDFSPLEYQVLKVQDIHSLVAAPLTSEGHSIGIIGIDNPPSDMLLNSSPFISTIGYFLASIITKENTENKLRVMSYQDSLTGLNNRNKFINDIQKYNYAAVDSLGIIYVDLNGLKQINDLYGHTAGDNKLIRLAQILTCIFDKSDVYRIGGDEFCVITTSLTKSAFDKRIGKLLEFLSDREDCSASIGYQYTNSYHDINDVIKEADKMMYSNKQKYYMA